MKKEIKKQLENKKIDKKHANVKWCLTLMLVAFFLTIVLSFLSEIAMKNVNLFIGIIVIIMFVFIGVVFDTIGVSVTAADEAPFHAMSSKKIRGAKTAVMLKKYSNRTSSFCCDVIGDICGIISGAAGVAVTAQIANIFNMNLLLSGLLVTGFIAALTIGGKAFEKAMAINNGNRILYGFAKILSIFVER